MVRQRLVRVAKRTRCKNAVTGLLAPYNVATPTELPALPRFQCELHAEQRVLLTTHITRLERQLLPTLGPDADVQRLLWIAGIGKIAAFTLHLKIDGIARFPDVRAFFSYCRLVPGAKNSGGKTRHKRAKDGNRYLKLVFSHAAVRAIQYYPEIQAWYRQRLRTKGAMIARALVPTELARIVYHVLARRQDFNGLFKLRRSVARRSCSGPWTGHPGSRAPPPHWTRRALATRSRTARPPSPLIGTGSGMPSTISGTPQGEPVMVDGRRCFRPLPRC